MENIFTSFKKHCRVIGARVSVLSVLTVLSAGVQAQQTAVTGIMTTFNGFWKSSVGTGNINSVKPNNSHDLLAFTFNGVTYSTGANDGLLTAQNITFSAGNYRALPVANRTGSVSGNTKIGLGQMYDGVSGGKSTPSPVNDLNKYLTDGLKGLDLGTCVANIPTGTIVFPTSNLKASAIGDGIPDVLVTQVADPSGSSFDKYQFVDMNGAVVGKAVDIVLNTIAPVGKWTADFYEANTNPMTLTSGYINTDRDIRLWAADFSYFGITAQNYMSIVDFKIELNGNSDVAFIAYNVDAFEPSSSANQPLPVSLVSFTGKSLNNQVLLNWQTASEKNNDRFEIEVSANGKTFEKAGTVTGSGTSSAVRNYSFSHKNAFSGIAYYRLKQVDFDGASEYSPIIAVNTGVSEIRAMLYPNPAKDVANLVHAEASGTELVQIMDLSGKVVLQQNLVKNATETTLKTAGLSKGFYQVVLQTESRKEVQKLIIE